MFKRLLRFKVRHEVPADHLRVLRVVRVAGGDRLRHDVGLLRGQATLLDRKFESTGFRTSADAARHLVVGA